jgi:hypothetical protein
MTLHPSSQFDDRHTVAPVVSIAIPLRLVGLVIAALCLLALVALASWSVDDPSLNKQTFTRLRDASEKFTYSNLVHIEPPFAKPRLDPGKVYFLNTQKLTKSSLLTRGHVESTPDGQEQITGFAAVTPDKQGWTIWETIANTVDDPDLTVGKLPVLRAREVISILRTHWASRRSGSEGHTSGSGTGTVAPRRYRSMVGGTSHARSAFPFPPSSGPPRSPRSKAVTRNGSGPRPVDYGEGSKPRSGATWRSTEQR